MQNDSIRTEPVALELAHHRGLAHPQVAGHFPGAVAGGHGLAQGASLAPPPRRSRRGSWPGRASPAAPGMASESAAVMSLLLAHDVGLLDDAHQLAHIARVVVVLQQAHGLEQAAALLVPGVEVRFRVELGQAEDVLMRSRSGAMRTVKVFSQ